MKVLLTGGAGLVGNSITELLLSKGAEVFCVDDFSLGSQKHIEEFSNNPSYHFDQIDVSSEHWHTKFRNLKIDLIIHLAANSDISLGFKNPSMEFQRTCVTTLQSLKAAVDLRCPNFMFSSSSAVYGFNPPFPTTESCPNLHPVSNYGAAKLASEAFISSFVENYGLSAWVFRFGNVVGEKLTHGVIYDFIRKLQKNPKQLDVLGNGNQSKTYIEVKDCTRGILWAFEKSMPGKSHAERFQVFNLSTEGSTSVRKIAELTNEIVTKGNAKIHYGSESVGWVGDVPKTSLDTKKMQNLSWDPKLDSTSAVEQSIQKHYDWITKVQK